MFPLTASEIFIRVIKALNEGFEDCFSLGSTLCLLIIAKDFIAFYKDQVNNRLDREKLKFVMIIMLGCDLVRMTFAFVTPLL